MRMLTIHADFIEYQPLSKAIEGAEDVEKEKKRIEDCLVVFVAVEAGDTEEVIERIKDEIINVATQIMARKIVIYPFVHLTSKPARPSTALAYLKELEKLRGYEVVRAPFGWYKMFNIKCKGHPLAELSREIKPKEREVTGVLDLRRPKYSERADVYVVLDTDGKEWKPEEYKYKRGEEDFKVIVEKEGLKKGLATEMIEPEFLKICKKFGIAWEPMSDIGHMRYAPSGALMFDLVADYYSNNVVPSLGIPIMFVGGTNMFNLAEEAVLEHAKLYGDRLYTMAAEDRECVLRYASCHTQFAMMKDWVISYDHLPFGVTEIADSYRFEQTGETLLCYRTRRFFMPDLHIFCRDEEEAKKWFEKVQNQIFEEIHKLGRNYEFLINLASQEYFEKNKEWIVSLLKKAGKPALLHFAPPGKNYYWTINIEYCIVDDLRRPREIATVQIDVGNAQRFGIIYTDKDGKKKHPVIIHTAILGSIERWLYTIFDTATAAKRRTGLIQIPLWINPEQVRILPVSDRHLKKAMEIARALEAEGIRVGIDDREYTISRKVRDANTDWINYVIVVGDREEKSKMLPVYVRKKNESVELTLAQFVKEFSRELGEMPRRKLPIPREMSKRPRWA